MAQASTTDTAGWALPRLPPPELLLREPHEFYGNKHVLQFSPNPNATDLPGTEKNLKGARSAKSG